MEPQQTCARGFTRLLYYDRTAWCYKTQDAFMFFLFQQNCHLLSLVLMNRFARSTFFFRLRPLSTFLTHLLTKLTGHSSFQKSFSLREPLGEIARKTRTHDIWISKTFHLSCQVRLYVLLMYRLKYHFFNILQMHS